MVTMRSIGMDVQANRVSLNIVFINYSVRISETKTWSVRCDVASKFRKGMRIRK